MIDRYEFSAPGYYRIVVQGRLRANWSERIGAMQVLSPQQDSELTVLEGHVYDQAELSGILNTIYELHLPLISVQHLGDKQPSAGDSG